MKINIDYHFHANISFIDSFAKRKCKKIWEKLKKEDIRVLISTEHAYKQPGRAFKFLNMLKPDGFYCFPGVECITKEGIDLIVFSNNEKIYDYDELKPFNLSYFDLINFVKSKSDLYSFVTHPHTLGLTSVINKLGFDAYKKSLSLLNAVEISNGAFDNLLIFMHNLKLTYLFKNYTQKIEKTRNLPKSEYPSFIKFLAVGSDAHHIEEIGNCFKVMVKNKIVDEKTVFDLIVNNSGNGQIIFDKNKSFSLTLLIKTIFTVLCEFIIKQKCKFLKI